MSTVTKALAASTAVGVGIAGLFLVSTIDYLLFHSLAELFTIVVGFSVFSVAWNGRRFVQNGYLLWVGMAYPFVAVLDALHMLTYDGMAVLGPSGANLGIELWVAARAFEALSLLLAAAFLKRRPNLGLQALGYAAALAVTLLTIFYWDVFPDAYDEAAQRLTRFKVTSEYAICAVLGAAGLLLVSARHRFHRSVLLLLLGAMATTITSELAFTLYRDPYGLANLLGHGLKIVSYWLVYVALLEIGLRRPYDLLFHDLKGSEQALRDSETRLRRLNAELEGRVRERTAKLTTRNEQLQKRSEQLRRLTSELTLAEQRERKRLAEVLHDHLQQMLVAARFKIEALSARVGPAHELARALQLLQESIDASRSLTVELYPPVLHQFGLPAAITWLAAWMKETHGLEIDLTVDPRADTDREDVRTLVFLSVRELLFNVVKHSGVRTARLELSRQDADHLRVTVGDTGAGLDPTTLETGRFGGGFGLASMRERLDVLGGSLIVDGAPGRGASFALVAPLVIRSAPHAADQLQ